MSAPLQIAVFFAQDTPAAIRAAIERALSPILRRHGGELEIGECVVSVSSGRPTKLRRYKTVSYATAVTEER